jgi:hypothetical protein
MKTECRLINTDTRPRSSRWNHRLLLCGSSSLSLVLRKLELSPAADRSEVSDIEFRGGDRIIPRIWNAPFVGEDCRSCGRPRRGQKDSDSQQR